MWGCGVWYNPMARVFGCDGHDRCRECLKGNSSADKNGPNCWAFANPPDWAEEFRCPRFVYRRRPDGKWTCVSDKLGIVVPSE